MRKLKLQVQITVDGFVAGPNGELDWMSFSTDERIAERVNELTDSSDTILLGRKMTDEFINYWTEVLSNPENADYSFAQKMVNIPKVVFSKTVTESRWVNTTVANGDLVEEVEKIKNSAGKDILVYGGASFVSSLIKNNLIDEYHLIVNPVAIGNGLRIFGDSESRLNLRLIKSEVFSTGEIELFYEPQKN
jgi:dihydrofolate reductase